MTTTPAAPRSTSTGSLLTTGVAAAALASIATPIVAVAGRAAGIGLDVGGAPIPVQGFAVLTAVFSLIGVILAAVLSRTARRPRRTFASTPLVVLTVLSLVPDVIVDAAPATKALLMLTHLVAAAIVVPAVARRLAGS